MFSCIVHLLGMWSWWTASGLYIYITRVCVIVTFALKKKKFMIWSYELGEKIKETCELLLYYVTGIELEWGVGLWAYNLHFFL